MSSNPSLYRYIDWIGGNILDATNVSLLQTELQRIGSQGAGQLYTQGTLLNALFSIAGTVITFEHANPSFHVFAFINGQFEDLGASVSIGPTTQPVTGAQTPLFLNWSWDIKTYTSDPSFTDGITGEPTIEAGQLSFTVDWTDTSINGDSSVPSSNAPTNASGVPLNPSTQFGKNLNPIVLAYFDLSVNPVTVTYINGVQPYAWGTPTQAGLVSLSPDAAWIVHTIYTLGQQIIDSNGNIQQVTFINGSTGETGGTVPSWNVTLHGTTVDNTITWTNEGPPVRGVAVSTTDESVTDARNPNIESVYNASVAPLIQTGFNSTSLPAWLPGNNYTPGNQIVDSNGNVETVVSISGSGTSGGSAPTWNTNLGGTTTDNPGANQITWVNGGTASTAKYDPATAGQGGIFTDSIIYTSLKQKLTTFLDSVNTSIENTLIALTNHIGKPLGSSETHPFPTAFQVGAAPASHVGQVLGLGTSHPAQVNSDHSGFVVLRNPLVVPASTDYAYELTDGTDVLAGILHGSAGTVGTADVFTQFANTFNAQGGNGGGGGGTATNKGTLGLMSLIAAVLAEHVNYTAAGVNVRNNNPHGLVSSDIGAASETYVNTQIADIISDVTAYTDAKTNIAVRVVTTVGPALGVGTSMPNGLPSYQMGNGTPSTNATITYIIVNIGGGFELALGFGSYSDGQQVALPEVSGWSSGNWYGVAAPAWDEIRTHDNQDSSFTTYVNPTTRIMTSKSSSSSGVGIELGVVVAASWRFITVAPIIISSFDNTASTFNSGSIGDTVTITGRNFGAVRGGSTVSFNGTPVVTYSSWSSTSLVVVIPGSATTGLITVVVSPNTATSPFVFTVI
jgi:hypothetical protein